MDGCTVIFTLFANVVSYHNFHVSAVSLKFISQVVTSPSSSGNKEVALPRETGRLVGPAVLLTVEGKNDERCCIRIKQKAPQVPSCSLHS